MGGLRSHNASCPLTFSALITAVVFGCEGIKGSLRDSLSHLISVNWGGRAVPAMPESCNMRGGTIRAPSLGLCKGQLLINSVQS